MLPIHVCDTYGDEQVLKIDRSVSCLSDRYRRVHETALVVTPLVCLGIPLFFLGRLASYRFNAGPGPHTAPARSGPL